MAAGEHTITLGNICCLIRFKDNFFQDTFDLYLSDYRKWGFCTDGSPHIYITVKKDYIPHPGSQNKHLFYHSLEYDSVSATILFDTRTSEGEIGFSISQSDNLTIVRITELIESFICNAFIFYLGLNSIGTFIHSCGIENKGAGYIFAGPSGYGKSTIAKLSKPKTILCDEMVLLRKDNYGGKTVYGTPFTGESESINRGAPCKGIYFIEQSLVNELLPVSRMSGAITLMKEGIMGNFLSLKGVHNIFTYNNFFSLLLDLLERIPCYRLKFKKDNSFWRLINGNENHTG
jgi:hypothetical protein